MQHPSQAPPKPDPGAARAGARGHRARMKIGALQDAIFNSANFSSIATDARGVIQIFNVGAERMLGYEAREVVDTCTPADISDPEELLARARDLSLELGTPIAPGFEALVFKASRGIEDIYELTYVRKDGSRFPALLSVTALRDAREAIIGYLLIGTDNSARKRIEAEQEKLAQRLRNNQFYTRSLFESNVDALVTVAPSGFIMDVNRQMEALTGCTRDELIGAPFRKFFTDPDSAQASLVQVLAAGKVTNCPLTVLALDGHETEVSCNATTFHDRDRSLEGVFVAARDITEARRMEAVLQAKNAELEHAKVVAEKANLAKSEFLSGMSHELRSPLNAILGFAQLMDSAQPPPSDSQKASLKQILNAGWYLLRLINEILDLAVVESGKLSISVEPVSLSEVLAECQAMIAPQAGKRDLRLEFEELDTPRFVLADRVRLKQVVLNFLSNAIKYNRPGGTVTVASSVLPSGRVRIGIQDTGAGLPPAMVEQLFQAFNRLGHEDGAEEGTGIGLVMSKVLVELMGGEVGVDSVEGVGSTFWFELKGTPAPRMPAEGARQRPAARPRAPRGSALRTVLYVEDNAANLELVQELVARRPDLHLLTADEGQLGVDLAREHLPEVILMDINLPGISGTEALALLREDPATAHIPVLAISANAMVSDVRAGLDLGFFRYLTKPINVQQFMEALDLALDHADRNPGAADEVPPR
ncbi:PAS domain-containing sensor histidine kinase [Geothrix sp. 21YS21S-2]|uniref:PAS domain-containing hybrid sensor histidine kinase/response regulator n=1 Tax=Geothrix sp. 21YS21S-2 TaxID=3068893 RepID=UPI0027BA52A2|nr:PAS domain-containing sensor histidine kinase [Geothrix sp. 21YS21S-2]